jgi:RND superfamily putative drug exporter
VTARDGRLAGLARFCYRRRRLVLALWVVGAVAVLFLGFRFAAAADNNFAGGDSESARAADAIAAHFPPALGTSLTLVVRAESTVDDDTVRARVENLLQRVRIGPITEVRSPYDAPGQISADHRTAYATLHTDQSMIDTDTVSSILATVTAAGGNGVSFALGGDSVVAVETPYGGAADGIGGTAAMVVILIAFGSLLAMGLTMAAALFGIGTGLAVILLLGHIFPAPAFSPIVSTLLGLGVGIDYALFIVTRYREALAEGEEPQDALVTSIVTAGRSVLYAGVTVVIAMMGLFVMGQRLLNATAIAASVTVLMTMISAVTLLPALLGFTGRNIDRLRLPYLGRTGARSPMAERWARAIQGRPVLGLVAGTVVMLTLAAPAVSMRLSFEDNSTEPHGTSGYTAHQWLTEAFGAGFDAPLIVVTTQPSTVDQLVTTVAGTAGVASVTPPRTSADGAAAMFIAYPSTGTQDAATAALVHTLRAKAGPAVHIGGVTPGTIDFADSVSTRLPWLITVVVGLSLLTLLVLVRSVVIAIKAAVMTLLSVAASYGVLTAIVQFGWLGGALGFPTTTPITAWVPLFIFPILFGLSTDYEVFLVSRIREEYDAGVPTREAVARGLSHTARVITAAAAIMVTVFLSVLATPEIAVKMFGLGLGIAVLLDATVVRMVLVPALMELLGKANWWLPRPLARVLNVVPAPAD